MTDPRLASTRYAFDLSDSEEEETPKKRADGTIDKKALVFHIARKYFNARPGGPDDNDSLHTTLHAMKCPRRKHEYGEKDFDLVHRALEWRLNRMTTADRYLEIMDVPQPDGQSCLGFNMMRYERELRQLSRDEERRVPCWLAVTTEEQREVLWPHPSRSLEYLNRYFMKGIRYVFAALWKARLGNEAIMEKIAVLTEKIEGEQKEMDARSVGEDSYCAETEDEEEDD